MDSMNFPIRLSAPSRKILPDWNLIPIANGHDVLPQKNLYKKKFPYPLLIISFLNETRPTLFKKYNTNNEVLYFVYPEGEKEDKGKRTTINIVFWGRKQHEYGFLPFVEKRKLKKIVFPFFLNFCFDGFSFQRYQDPFPFNYSFLFEENNFKKKFSIQKLKFFLKAYLFEIKKKICRLTSFHNSMMTHWW